MLQKENAALVDNQIEEIKIIGQVLRVEIETEVREAKQKDVLLNLVEPLSKLAH